jgi:hypothetical protein
MLPSKSFPIHHARITISFDAIYIYTHILKKADSEIEVRSPAEAKDFSLASVPRPALGPTQPPTQWVPGVLSPGCDADHSPPSSAEVKNE